MRTIVAAMRSTIVAAIAHALADVERHARHRPPHLLAVA